MTGKVRSLGPKLRQEKIAEAVRRAVSMRPTIESVPRGTLYDQTQSIKARRVIDSRPRPE